MKVRASCTGTAYSALLSMAMVGSMVGLQGCQFQEIKPDVDAAPSRQTPATTTSENAQDIRGVENNSISDSASGTPVKLAAAPIIEKDLWERIRRQLALPDEDNARVRSELAWFKRNQDYLDRVTERARLYLHYVVHEIEQRHLPMELALLPVIESGFQPFAYSPARASGIWQFIPATGRLYGLKQNWWYDGRRDIVESTRAALNYLQKLQREFEDDWYLAIAAYNSGEGNVHKAIRRNQRAGKPVDFWSLRLPRETRAYVPRLLAVAAIVRDPKKHGLRLNPLPNEPYFQRVELDGQIDIALAADLADLSLEKMYLLNPGFNRWATDPDGPHALLLPIPSTENFEERVAKLSPEQRVKWRRHRIRQGETLGGIARRHRTTVAVLKRINGLRGHTIRADRRLIVPVPARSPRDYTLSASARRAASIRKGPAEASKVTYRVRRGDSLWNIARTHRVSLRKLTAWNGVARGDILRPGQELTIWHASARPAGSQPRLTSDTVLHQKANQRIRYTVRRGDSLWSISRRFNVSVIGLRKWNGLKRGAYLRPGQRLTIHIDVTRQSES